MSYITDGFDDEVAALLQNGMVGVLPTDTIYGISAQALNEQAVERIHRLKLRDSGKPLIVLISDIKMLDMLSISGQEASLVGEYWPGALSLEFAASDSPFWLHRGQKHFAIRMPNHPQLLSLIDKVGPIVSTSVNLQAQQSVDSIHEAKNIFGEQLDFYVDVGQLNNLPSTIAVIEEGRIKVVRPGAVKINT